MNVTLLCGPSGSGKTTLARTLEAAGAERLSFDVELWRRGERPLTASRELLLEVDADLKARLVRLVREGRDVVLDLPFATRALRKEWRALVAPLGVVPEIVYLQVPHDVLAQRLAARADAAADDVALTLEQIERHLATFEPPTPDEGPLRILRPDRDPTH